jgi:hypothetical protein
VTICDVGEERMQREQEESSQVSASASEGKLTTPLPPLQLLIRSELSFYLSLLVRIQRIHQNLAACTIMLRSLLQTTHEMLEQTRIALLLLKPSGKGIYLLPSSED